VNANFPSRTSCAALTRWMAIALFVNAIVLNALLWLLAPSNDVLAPETRVMLRAGETRVLSETVLRYTRNLIHAQGGNDSWQGMAIALDYARAPHTTPLYSEIFFNRHIKYQYPPSSLFVIAAMQSVDPTRIHVNHDYQGSRPSIDEALGLFFLAVMALATAALLELRLQQTQSFTDCHKLVTARLLLLIAITITFYPIVKGFALGQIQVWLNALFALSLLCWAANWKIGSGVLVGLICLVKPHYGVFLIWGAVRGQWRFVSACAITCGIGLAASIAVFGLADHLDYLRALALLSERGEDFYPNQSFNGLLNRLVGDPLSNLLFVSDRFPPFHPVVYGGTLAATALLLVTAIFLHRWRSGAIEFCIMALSATLAAPIAWEHHYGILLPIFAVLLASMPDDWRWRIWFSVSFVLASNFFAVTKLLAPTVMNVGQSYLFAAAVIVLMLLYLLPATIERECEVPAYN
jgi:alpha-1,2-mannosyltransferase